MIGAVVLAAGRAERLGQPKQLLRLGARPMLQHVIDTATASTVDTVVVVLGAAHDEVAAAIDLPDGAQVVVNRLHARGLSTSLRTGLGTFPEPVEAAVVLLGDQPTVTTPLIEAVVDAYRRTARCVVRTRYDGGVPGHPVLLRQDAWVAASTVRGDRGARDLLRRRDVLHVDVAGAPPPDVDTWDDYRRMLGRWDHPSPVRD